MAAYTPGPWTVNGSFGDAETHPQLTIESNYGQITALISENCDDDEQVIGDAKLIAASPELLEHLDNVTATLETLLAHYGSDMHEADRVNRTRLATEAREAVERLYGRQVNHV